MEKRKLGKSDLSVSLICLGTMTWGEQNSVDEGYAQMDYAVDHGINFFDTAELYAIPPKAETYGRTEEIIGEWFRKTGKRNQIILASKVAGPSADLSWIRGTNNSFDRQNIETALEASLNRLQTDYIDLYQLHWPERSVNSFGTLGFNNQEIREAETEGMLGVLQVLSRLVEAGKIRHIGLSNETAWGAMTFLNLAEKHGLTRFVSIQNPYNLLNRSYEVALAEVSLQEKCGLLAYSPLARGTLTGKYLDGQLPSGSARAIDNRKSRYSHNRGDEATAAYVALAQKFDLDPAQMAIAYVNQKPFVSSNIIGATTLEQLSTNIAAHDLSLSEELLDAIELVHAEYTYPCP